MDVMMWWCDMHVCVCLGGGAFEIAGRERGGHAPSVRYTIADRRALGTALYSLVMTAGGAMARQQWNITYLPSAVRDGKLQGGSNKEWKAATTSVGRVSRVGVPESVVVRSGHTNGSAPFAPSGTDSFTTASTHPDVSCQMYGDVVDPPVLSVHRLVGMASVDTGVEKPG